MCRVIAFAIFWIAVGMLLMLFFRYRIIGAVFAVLLLVVSYFVMGKEDW